MNPFFELALQEVNTTDYIIENKEVLDQLKTEKSKTASSRSLIYTINDLLKFNMNFELARIKCPVLLISGGNDLLVDPYLAEEIHESISNSQWIIKKGLGHNLLLPPILDELSEDILNFLEDSMD